jgi:hypothetical protein
MSRSVTRATTIDRTGSGNPSRRKTISTTESAAQKSAQRFSPNSTMAGKAIQIANANSQAANAFAGKTPMMTKLMSSPSLGTGRPKKAIAQYVPPPPRAVKSTGLLDVSPSARGKTPRLAAITRFTIDSALTATR